MAKKPVPVPTLLITVTGPERGRWRGRFGTPRFFIGEPQEFTDLTLTADEIEELQEDPELKVVVTELVLPSDESKPADVGPVDAPAPDPAPVDPAAVEPAQAEQPAP